jgi:exopolyphosphatase/pppGpp-phosphohydrolase
MLSRASIEELAAALGGLTAERLVREGRFSPTRARLLPAGAALVLAFMERFELASIEISPASLREGAVLAVVHGGATWRSELSRLTLGWQS